MRAGFAKCIFAFAVAAVMASAQQKPDLSGVWTAKNMPGRALPGMGLHGGRAADDALGVREV